VGQGFHLLPQVVAAGFPKHMAHRNGDLIGRDGQFHQVASFALEDGFPTHPHIAHGHAQAPGLVAVF
jgi:hypothetical protein